MQRAICITGQVRACEFGVQLQNRERITKRVRNPDTTGKKKNVQETHKAGNKGNELWSYVVHIANIGKQPLFHPNPSNCLKEERVLHRSCSLQQHMEKRFRYKSAQAFKV
jgi:hypothetical protein